MKKITLLLSVLLCSLSAWAQTPTRVTRQVVKVLVEQSAVSKGTISRYAGAHGALMGIDYQLQHNMPKTRVLETTVQRSWLEQQQRNFKAAQLKRQRRMRDTQLQQEAQELAAREAILATLPKANPEHAFVRNDFTDLLPDQMPPSDLPLVAEPGTLFRGLALATDGQAVANILQNGLLLADTGTEANTRNLAFAGGTRGAVQAISNHPVTNLTSFPVNAANWAVKRLTPEKPLVAVVAVNGQTQAGKIVLASEDIPASQITHFIVPLNVEASTVWCNVELQPDGDFLITPYDIPPARE
ncbi:MAG: hypothetical protein IJ876_08035 [Elusimicrobiaceae bacterium]|nr:hypothetical protein [Elusimicrobiaceae bacterium]